MLIVFCKFTAILLLSRHKGRLSGQAVDTVESCNSSFAKKFKASIGQIFNRLWMEFKVNFFLPANSPEFFEVDLPSDFWCI